MKILADAFIAMSKIVLGIGGEFKQYEARKLGKSSTLVSSRGRPSRDFRSEAQMSKYILRIRQDGIFLVYSLGGAGVYPNEQIETEGGCPNFSSTLIIRTSYNL